MAELSFAVILLAAQFPREASRVAPEMDHLVLLVRPSDTDEPLLVDVGAGRDSFATPLATTTTAKQPQAGTGTSFRFEREGDRHRVLRRQGQGGWEPSYLIGWRPRVLVDFDDGRRSHQTSPDSTFPRGRVGTLMTPAGRVTLSERRLIETSGGVRTERELPDEMAYVEALRTRFGIDLGEG